MSVFTTSAHRIAVVVMAPALLAGCSGGSDPDPTPPLAAGSDTPSSSAEPAPSPIESAPEDDVAAPGDGTLGKDGVDLSAPEREQVVKGIDDFVRAQQEELSAPRDWTPNEDIHVPGMTGSALDDLLVTSEEYFNNGWRVVGAPRVVAHQVVRRVEDPDAVVVRICVDNSDVRVEEADGTVVPHSRGTGRTLNVVALVKDGDGWVVTSQRVASLPDC